MPGKGANSVSPTSHAEFLNSGVGTAPPRARAPLDHDAVMAIADATGEVLWQSAGMQRRLGAARPDGRSCCELLACQANTAHHEVCCLTELALAGGMPAAGAWR